MLRGMNCERFIENFAEAGVNLFEFLTITDERLKQIGIEFKFERNIILMGLHNFHYEPWTTESLFIPENFTENLSDLDVMMMLANVLRQLVVIKSQVVYMERLGKKFKITKAFKNLSEEFLEEFQGNVKQLKTALRRKKIEKPLVIKKKIQKENPIKRFAKFTLFVPVIAFVVFKFLKK